jgi:hypothetical protein
VAGRERINGLFHLGNLPVKGTTFCTPSAVKVAAPFLTSTGTVIFDNVNKLISFLNSPGHEVSKKLAHENVIKIFTLRDRGISRDIKGAGK